MPGRRWLGWYNSPGTFEIAAQYARIANLKICDSLFPNGEPDPSRLFGLDGRIGPRYISAHTGVILECTGQPGSLIASQAEAIRLPKEHVFEGDFGKSGTGQNVTVINLQDSHLTGRHQNPISFPPLSMSQNPCWALIPISASVATCILCALVADWYCFTSIAVGMLAHGFACSIVGSGKLNFKRPRAADGSPPGDGVLVGDRDMVILIGPGSAINTITRGRFFLEYGGEEKGHPVADSHQEKQADQSHRTPCMAPWPFALCSQSGRAISTIRRNWRQCLIWLSAILLMAQPLIQLFLIPLGTLFGQLMFIVSIIASWTYNLYLSYYVDRDVIQTKILFGKLKISHEHMQKYHLTTLTSAVVFTCLILASVHQLDDPLPLLSAMLPNDTVVWKRWKNMIAKKLKDLQSVRQGQATTLFSDEELKKGTKKLKAELEGGKTKSKGVEAAQDREVDLKLLGVYLRDAENAWTAWRSEFVHGSKMMVALRQGDGAAT